MQAEAARWLTGWRWAFRGRVTDTMVGQRLQPPAAAAGAAPRTRVGGAIDARNCAVGRVDAGPLRHQRAPLLRKHLACKYLGTGKVRATSAPTPVRS